MTSTPFSEWSKLGQVDPHGLYYHGSMTDIACGNMPTSLIAHMLKGLKNDVMSIQWLMAGKDRLRWLSRKLFSISDNHEAYNQHRATMAMGSLSDDQLANAFFISESKEDLEAGHDRIIWLSHEIELILSKKSESQFTEDDEYIEHNSLISDIKFTISEDIVSFTYTCDFDQNLPATAELQLPSTPESLHFIDCEELDRENKRQVDIYNQLIDFYFKSIKIASCKTGGFDMKEVIGKAKGIKA